MNVVFDGQSHAPSAIPLPAQTPHSSTPAGQTQSPQTVYIALASGSDTTLKVASLPKQISVPSKSVKKTCVNTPSPGGIVAPVAENPNTVVNDVFTINPASSALPPDASEISIPICLN
jgi:hypothetical protein